MDSEEEDDWQEALEYQEDEQVPVKSTLIVGAIDFGTTFSGWGYSLVTDFNTDPTKVIVKNWLSESGALVTEKAPTCVLIKPDGETLEAFGYEAENRYRELRGDYYYFETFKMLLNKKMDESLDRYTEIEDVTGKCLPAMTVFSKTIEYLTNDMLSDAKKKLFGAITKDDVRWVLTVPAIWSDAAKQFMREAAIQCHRKITRRTFADVLSESIYSTTIEIAGDKIKFQAEVMKNLFKFSLDHIIDHLKTLLEVERVKDVRAILMVGGYSDSPMLQHAVKSSIPDVATVIPIGAATSVLKGAVIFGYRPHCISERVVKSTYGVAISKPFIEGVHPESKRLITDAGVRCNGLFYKHIEMEQSVAVNKVLEKHAFTPVNKNKSSQHFKIYASKLKKPTFVDQGCTQIGEMIVDLPDPDEDLNRKIWVAFSFGGTEINVEGEDERSRKKVKVTLDLLQQDTK